MIEWSILLAAVAWSAVCTATVLLIVRGMRTLRRADACFEEGQRLSHQLQVLTRRADEVLKQSEETVGTINEWAQELKRTRRVLQRGNDVLERIVAQVSQRNANNASDQRLTDMLQMFELGYSVWSSIQAKRAMSSPPSSAKNTGNE
ncbi:hypothetical protein [Paenibacillus alvei]|uniref:hypothetical protein n=1 Tax=Paenibacillus alvei TaxID=44250 RepID=UPI0013D93354|nr:hypothetical protein [Paenibacillus alvei]NEZ44114.1 hypothetical protein [Paenibacillus alvei]